MTGKIRILRRGAAALLAAALWIASGTFAAAEKVVTLSFAGDCTLGSEEAARKNPLSFDSVAKEKGYDYFFANFLDLFENDDCTVVNCECVLDDNWGGENKEKSFRFRANEDYVNIFKAGSVEAVTLANNHILDYGDRGMKNTKRVLEEAGIGWTRGTDIYIFEKDGIRIAFVGADYRTMLNFGSDMRKKLQNMKKKGQIHASVVLLHEGNEYAWKHIDKQDEYSEYFIEKVGSDLVMISHPHVVQGIRILKNRTICYSLGNFIFGGYHEVTRGENGTNSLHSMVVQVKMYFEDDGTYKGQQMILYPAYDSGTDPKNNYQPVRVTMEQAKPVIEAIQKDTAWELPPLQADENGLAYMVFDYLPASKEQAKAAPAGSGPEPAPAAPARSSK